MRNVLSTFPILATVVLATAAVATPATRALLPFGSAHEQEEDDEAPIDVAKLPAPVQAAAKHLFGSLAGTSATQEDDHGVTLFEVDGKGADGMALSIKCVAGGQVLEVERATAVTALPAAVRQGLRAAYPGATPTAAEELEVHYFEVRLEKDGKTMEALIRATGRMHETGNGAKRKSGDEEDED